MKATSDSRELGSWLLGSLDKRVIAEVRTERFRLSSRNPAMRLERRGTRNGAPIKCELKTQGKNEQQVLVEAPPLKIVSC